MSLIFGGSTILVLWRNQVPYTRFEKARIIGARALQLSMGAPSTLANIPKDVIDPLAIAMLEFTEEAIPITVKQDI
jgi:DNA-directed RNA polymerase subunit K